MSTTNNNAGAYYAMAQIASAAYSSHAQSQMAREGAAFRQWSIDQNAALRAKLNEREAERATTSRMLGSLNSQRAVRQAGARRDAALAVIGRMTDVQGLNKSERRLRLQQELGALAAQSAFQGTIDTTGATAGTMLLREQRAEQLAVRKAREQSFLLQERAVDAGGDVMASIDPRAVFANLNYAQDPDATTPYTPSVLTAIMASDASWRELTNYAGQFFKDKPQYTGGAGGGDRGGNG